MKIAQNSDFFKKTHVFFIKKCVFLLKNAKIFRNLVVINGIYEITLSKYKFAHLQTKYKLLLLENIPKIAGFFKKCVFFK